MSILDSYSETNQDAGLNLHSATVTRCGQSFTPFLSGNLTSVQFYLLKSGSPTGNITASLYNTTPTLSSANIPVGLTLAVSNPLDASTLTGSYQWVTFSFVASPFLIAGMNYIVCVNYSGGDVSNYITVGYDSSGNHLGTQSRYQASWTAFNVDTCFVVEGNENYIQYNKKIIKGVRVSNGMSSSG